MMSEDDIKGIIAGEMTNASSDLLLAKKIEATRYYNGELPAPSGIMGRSAVVSTDVCDAVEWLLPNLVESLTGKAVKFQPMSAQDEDQAELETDLTHFAFSEENNGYLNLYEAAKDALLTGVGIWKIYFDDTPERVVEHYAGVDENQLQALLGDPMLEVTSIERSETDGTNVTAARITRSGKVKVEAVPAEEFRVSDDADSLDLTEARFCAHTVRRTASDLLASGYDPEIIEGAGYDNLERDTEDYYSSDLDLDDSQKQIVVTEAYLHIDINDDGIGEFCKITFIGESNPSEILDIEEIAEMPFVAMSAIPTPHKFEGVSVFDRLKQVQDTKTAVLRSTLDSFYQSINRIKVVTEGSVNIDDLLVTRPGGIIRAKQPNSVQELGGTFFGGEALQLLQYADTQKDSRVGVSPDMAGQANLVNQESAHGVERIQSAKEMLVGLMIRSIAETGIRPAYRLIRDLMVRYQTATVPYKFRGEWMNVNPSDWGERSRMTVCVGTGASNDEAKIMGLQQLLGVQQQMMQDPAQPLVDYNKVYNTLDQITTLGDIGEAEKYFYNPNSQEGQMFGQQKQQGQQQQAQEMMQKEAMQLEMQQATVQAQMKVADAEMGKAQATQQNGQLKAQIDAMKNQYNQEIEQLKVALQAAKDNKAQEFQLQNMKTQAALKLTELEIQAKRDLNKDVQDNKDALNGGSTERSEEGTGGQSRVGSG
jgi:hypothetical protein